MASAGFSQPSYQVATVAFYNVENLFDTIASVDYLDGTRSWGDVLFHRSIPANSALAKATPLLKAGDSPKALKGKKGLRAVRDRDFTPSGSYQYTAKRYWQKIDRISKTLAEIGYSFTHTAPVVIGLAEVENANVLDDLIRAEGLRAYGYRKVHFNSFDARGIDVALLYQEKRFTPIFTKTYSLYLLDGQLRRKYTRDLLLVSGVLDGELIHFIVNHWPSRYGGEARSRPFRMRAAHSIRDRIIPDIQLLDPHPKIVILGDFNDDPISPSIRKGLGCTGKRRIARRAKQLYNPMEALYRHGSGTLAWRDSWNLFDQLIVSPSLLRIDYRTYRFYRAAVFDKAYLRTPRGAFKGYPYRTYAHGVYRGGYSDHFPVYAYLLRKAAAQ